MNFKEIAFEVESIAKEAARYILEQRKSLSESDVETKGLHNYVTYIDKGSESLIIDHLKPLINNAGFIAEENTQNLRGKEFNWIIDPLDGTTNFIHGVPICSVSIALMQNSEIVVGEVLEIFSGESFLAWKDGPALCNGKPVQVSRRSNVKEILLATGFPYYDYDLLDQYLALFKHFMKNTRGLRRLGSAALDLAWVACGRFDGFYEYGLNEWDVAAGSFIVERAGGKCSDFEGKPHHVFGRQILSSNGILHQQLLNQIQMFFP
ncbi:MAG TPA: inositol monophosphatase family protein [Bacteroidales bacterium]|jgi:myo-inositol-1(or 4)-monophosphatase|nr:inositol monophosphatase [Bacteroidales bacterium]MDI9573591.1 inositol monophosphatase family protein [Bacteroidota bacterium]OQC61956.1 MAG: Inositol-1-monophosphatase [Bacteroidetes bacterium ADurb.Bin012]HNQ59004.1 inositol monophosphatase family protein [Bacteroidales bacterium]HNU20752.1 inositol monophosphatase family protein [Bacteroidales bacterium]